MIKKSGTVVITGKPNVGKSTLLNAIAKKEMAIVSPKPQTTRNQIIFVYNDENNEIAFIDTPGYHESRNKLNLFLNSQIKNSYKYANLILLLIDLTREINQEDLEVIKMVKSFNVDKIILVLNKIDKVSPLLAKEYEQKIKSLIHIDYAITCSGLKQVNVNELITLISNNLKNDPVSLATTNSDNFIISEIIREQIIYNFRQEIPYSACVCIKTKEYNKQTNTFTIYADIIVEKESQKPIIIGAKGSMIKKIGIHARKKLNEYYDCKIVLNLFVVVKKDWRNNQDVLKTGGYV